MELNKLYKHIDNKDVAFAPIAVLYSTPERIGYQGLWYNIANPDRKPLFIEMAKIHLKQEDLPNWKDHEHAKY